MLLNGSYLALKPESGQTATGPFSAIRKAREMAGRGPNADWRLLPEELSIADILKPADWGSAIAAEAERIGSTRMKAKVDKGKNTF